MTYNRCMAKRDDDLEFSVNAAFDEARAVVDKVPLYLVNGSLGAGKTSVLEFLLQQSDYKGARVIENEYANENVDGYRLLLVETRADADVAGLLSQFPGASVYRGDGRGANDEFGRETD